MTHNEERRTQRLEVARWVQIIVLSLGLSAIIYKVGQRDQELTELKSIVTELVRTRFDDKDAINTLEKRVQRIETLSRLDKPQS